LKQHLCLHLLRQQFGCVLQMLSESIRKPSETNRSEKVDGEACIARIIGREETTKDVLHDWVGKSLSKLGKAERFGKLLGENFDENTRRRGRVIFVEFDVLQASPRQGISG